MSLLSPALQAFVQVVETQTVHAAAKRLGLTQTGVTQRIRTLERSLGVTLFTRSRRGMEPTHEGRALWRYCLDASEVERIAMTSILESARQVEVEVKIVGPTSIMRSRLIPAISVALSEFKHLLLALALDDSKRLIERLKDGSAQLAVIPRESVTRELDSKLLRPERYLLVGPKKWRSRSLSEIISTERMIDFDAEDFSTHQYLKKYKLLTLARAGRLFVNNNESLCGLISQGLGYGVLTEEFADPWLKDGRLVALNEGRAIENHLALAWYPRSQMPAYFQRIIRLAK